MDLYIAEKPSLGRTIAEHLADGQRCETGVGFIKGSGWVVTWCIGHLYTLCEPGDYSDQWAGSWNIDSLPLIPGKFKYKPIERTAGQLKVVHSLMLKAQRVFHCGDPDREGQYLVDLVISHSSFSAQVFRVWLDDLSPSGLHRVFSKIKPNSDYRSLSLSAQCRAQADWLVGINFTRLYTCMAQEKGFPGTLSLGRVQTVAYALVHNRCIDIEKFKPLSHFRLQAHFLSEQGDYSGEWLMPDACLNEQGYCVGRDKIVSVGNAIRSHKGVVSEVDIENKSESAPLPFSLSALQVLCSEKWGYGAKQVLNACQYLYEDLRALSYPRTDCRYLSEGDCQNAPNIVSIINSALDLNINEHLIFTVKPRCYNDSKTTAHTAIVPTSCKPDFGKFDKIPKSDGKARGIGDRSVLENIYKTVALRFLCQFMAKLETQSTTITTVVDDEHFKSKGQVTLNPGWLLVESLLGQQNKTPDKHLPKLSKNQIVKLSEPEILDKKTKPPAHFTEGTLIAAMANISKYVDDPDIRQKLRDSDGIGTEPTRADIIERLKRIGYIRANKKQLNVTSLGREVYPSIPPYFKSPTMTAVWESALKGIADSRLDHNAFHRNITSWTEVQIQRLKQNPPEINFSVDDKYKCKVCESVLVRKNGRFGAYWLCVNRQCKQSYKDFKYSPLYPLDGHGDDCPECKKNGRDGLMMTKIKKANIERGTSAKFFLGCDKFPECKHAAW